MLDLTGAGAGRACKVSTGITELTGGFKSAVAVALTVLPNWEILVRMRVIAKSSLQKFWERPGCGDARGPLHSWYDEAIKATWRSPQDVKDRYANASICGNNEY